MLVDPEYQIFTANLQNSAILVEESADAQRVEEALRTSLSSFASDLRVLPAGLLLKQLLYNWKNGFLSKKDRKKLQKIVDHSGFSFN